MSTETRRTPWWIWALMGALALSQPLVLLLIQYAPPEGSMPTGLHIPDSALFRHSMHMFENGFESPYATCQSKLGSHSTVFYSVPHLWLYGVLGLLARFLGANYFLFYGFANGAGAFFYLLVVYRLLMELVPRQAKAAFLLFGFSGGLGGILYVFTGVLGLHAHPAFETYFSRFAFYELMEGPHFNPVLYFPRLYYTLSLALCLGALTAIIRASRSGARRMPLPWAVAVILGSFINARFTVFVLGLLLLYLLLEHRLTGRERILLAASYAIPAAMGLAAAHALMRTNPAVVENHLQVGNMAMWLSPFITVAWLHLVISGRPIMQVVNRLPKPARATGFAAVGYLIAYALLYLVYQGYYGNLLTGRDGSVAAHVSDWALLGAAAGVLGLWRTKPDADPQQSADWMALWLLLYLAVSLSGWCQGWFLRFGPQRLQVFLWLPLCIFTAMGIERLRPRFARVAWAVLLVCGATSVLVATFAFQSPFGRTNAQGPFASQHAEVMSANDAALMRLIGTGPVLAPAPASDVIARNQGNPVIYGIGSFNLTDQPYLVLRKEVDTFFAAATPDAVRRDIAHRWCVRYIYCPDTWPVSAATRDVLRKTPWLRETATQAQASIFEVMAP